VRALLIVNPHATSTTPLRRDVIAAALASAVQLEVVETRYRGHAASLARAAADEGMGLVITLGGDGTVNEAVNGILAAAAAEAGRLPALAALPGGNANVFSRSLGLPADAVEATGQILRAIRHGQERTIGLGHAGSGCPNGAGSAPSAEASARHVPASGQSAQCARRQCRYFTFNAGLGLDAEVVRAVDGLRAHGRAVTPALYLRTALRQYFRTTDRRHPALILERDGYPPSRPLFLGVVSNTSPWTYLGSRAVTTNLAADFDSGLDLFALRTLRTAATISTLRQMLRPAEQPHGRAVLTLHDQPELTLRAARPIAFQVDGEYMGESESVRFVAVPAALRVLS
jgi:diacylglycerol kinase family enzyme